MSNLSGARTTVLAVLLGASCLRSGQDVLMDEASSEVRGREGWSAPQRDLMTSLSLVALPRLAPSVSNRVSEDARAATLGHRLFFDPGLSADGSVACATCHVPKRYFTDGARVSRGLGPARRNAPTLVGAAHSPWMFWDGRRDSLWSQALVPLEAELEMGAVRNDVVRYVTTASHTRDLYGQLFGRPPPMRDLERFPPGAGPFASDASGKAAWHRMSPPDRLAVDRAFANVGKALEAYERKLLPGPGRFDAYVASLSEAGERSSEPLSVVERRGLELFLDASRTLCLRCHNGPLFTNHSFHRVATSRTPDGASDMGRFLGLQSVLMDPFNCLGPFSDADAEACQELRFANKAGAVHAMGKFRTPTLRNVARTGPYMHDGRFETLEAVVEHYRNPPSPGAEAHELSPIDLDDEEAAALVAFLGTLTGEIAAEARWLEPPARPFGSPRR